MFSKFNLSLRLKLILIFTLVFGCITFIFDGLTFRMMVQALEEENDINLYNLAVEFYNSDESQLIIDSMALPDNLEKRKIFAFQTDSVLAQIRHISGRVLYSQGNFGDFDFPYNEKLFHLKKDDDAIYKTLYDVSSIPNPEANSYRMISLLWKAPDTVLQIAVPRTHVEAVRQRHQQILWFGVPTVFILAALAGSFIAGRALQPIRNVIATAQEIDGSELSQRVPVSTAHDEITLLATTFNEMLDRIQKAFESQERFIADASHQLLSPLTVMKTEVELTLRNKELNEKEKILLSHQQQEVDQLIRIVQDMLILARIDAGRGALKLEDVYLDEIIMAAVQKLQKLANQKSIKVIVELDNLESYRRTWKLDSDLMQHLFQNLIENAIKYSPPSGNVWIHLISNPKSQIVLIKDQGPGIPADQIDKIFLRFLRDPKLSKNVKGFGLGLAIARKIAELHGASLFASPHIQQGAEFQFEIAQRD